MTNNYLTKKTLFIYDESQKTLIKIRDFHKNNHIYKKIDFDSGSFQYLLGILTTLEILDDKIANLLNKIRIFNKNATHPINQINIKKLEDLHTRIKNAKEIEKRFL